MNDIDRQIESIHSARMQLKDIWGKHYELGALVDSIPLLEELRELRKTKGKVIATIKFSKKDMQEIVDKKMQEIEFDIQATRNATIDEFLNRCKERVEKTKIARLELFEICEIAEELKGGKNE